jgi:peptidoglycan/LPS O-acetylase OafA/YrhL
VGEVREAMTKLLRTLLVIVLILTLQAFGTYLWTVNKLPGFQVAPDPHERRACELAYGFDILTRKWECTDWSLWLGDAGIPGGL